mmetsp:Transcript_90820/g.234521  ORF Transcript_90820/g.234521 Transcript_90820/m.234521 type:complete len:281 (+) Transcript_90820:1-843(+)
MSTSMAQAAQPERVPPARPPAQPAARHPRGAAVPAAMDVDSQAASAEKALQELQQATQVSIKGKDKDKLAEQRKQITACERLIPGVKNCLESYRLELRSLQQEQQGEHNERLRRLEEGLKQCKTQIEWKRLDADAIASAAAGSSSAGGATEGAGEGGVMSLDQAVVAAEETQKAGAQSLQRSLGMALNAEKVGIATLETMHAQEEQMSRIAEDVEDIKANLVRSRKLVGQLARGAAKDRCIQMLCALITIAVLIMVVLAMTGRDGGSLNMPDQVRQVGRD